MTVLAAISDLFFWSKVDGASKALGVSVLRARRNIPLSQQLNDTGATTLLLELASSHHGGPDAVVELRKDASLAGVHVVGFARHTEVDLFRQGRAAGCSKVLTQGEFSDGLEALLRQG